MKTRLELECHCIICGLKFIIYEGWLPKEAGSGSHIGHYSCPNCEQKKLDLDILCQEIPK